MTPITSRRTRISGNKYSPLGAVALALLTLVDPAAARADGWRISVIPYAWATDVGVDAKIDGRQMVDKEIPVGDLVKDLDTTVQLRLEAQHRQYGLSIDLFDVTLSDDVKGLVLPQAAGQADLHSDVGMTILDVAGTYDPKGDRRGVSFLLGARILDQRAAIDATFYPAPGVSVPGQYDTDETLTDGLIGVRYTKPLSRRWTAQARVDGSAGGTDYTYSFAPSLSYAFGKAGQTALIAGYRFMKVDFADHDGLDTTMKLSGALLGFRATF